MHLRASVKINLCYIATINETADIPICRPVSSRRLNRISPTHSLSWLGARKERLTVKSFIERVVLSNAPGKLLQTGLVALPPLVVVAVGLLSPALAPYLGPLICFPAVALAAALFGWRHGLAAVALFGMAEVLFQLPRGPGQMAPGNMAAWDMAAIPMRLAAAAAVTFIVDRLRGLVLDFHHAAECEMIRAAELDHRAKNNLAMVEALARQTQRSGRSGEDFFEAFTPRLQAFARAQDLLRKSQWQGATLPSLAHEALRPFADHPGLRIDGPECPLPGRACMPLVLALHELATNASKYGALSCPGGMVDLFWSAHPTGSWVEIDWQERNGPIVTKPKRRGLGSRLLARGYPGLVVDHQFNREGVRCIMRLNCTSPGAVAASLSTAGDHVSRQSQRRNNFS